MFEDPKRGYGASLSWRTMGEWGLRLERAGSGRPVSQLWPFAFAWSPGKILEGLSLAVIPLFWPLFGMGAWVVPGIS